MAQCLVPIGCHPSMEDPIFGLDQALHSKRIEQFPRLTASFCADLLLQRWGHPLILLLRQMKSLRRYPMRTDSPGEAS